MVADGPVGRLRRDGDEGLEGAGRAPPSRCTARCSARFRRCRGCGSSPASIRRCRRRGSTTSSWCWRATRRRRSCSRRWARWSAPAGRAASSCTSIPISRSTCRRRGWSIDREQVADLGLDLASVGQELGTLLGGGYVNRFNFFDRSYKVIPQIGERGPRHGGAAARPQDQDPERRAGAGLDLHPDRDQHRAADAQPVPAAQCGPDLRRRAAGRHQGGGLAGAGGRGDRGRRPGRRARLRRRVAPDPARGLGAHRHARLRAWC